MQPQFVYFQLISFIISTYEINFYANIAVLQQNKYAERAIMTRETITLAAK